MEIRCCTCCGTAGLAASAHS